MFFKERVLFLAFVLPHVFSSSCMSKCGVPSEWQSIATNVCYGTKGDKFGKFTMDRECKLFALRLVHVSGFQNYDKSDASHRSRWGFSARMNPFDMNTVLLKNKQLLFPKKFDDEYHSSFSLAGFMVNDDVISFKLNETLARGENLKIAFSPDFKDRGEHISEGTHCVDVDVSCYV